MLHAKALAVVVAYDMYLECCEGTLNPVWKVKRPVDFYTFREKLGTQMLHYNPTQRKYPGDEKFRVATQQPKKRRHVNVSRRLTNPTEESQATDSASSAASVLTRDHFRNNTKRLCGDLTFLYRHVQSVKPTDSSGRICVVCGLRCYSVCTACGEAMHRFPPKNNKKKEAIPCFYHHHNTSFFGLSKRDASASGTKSKEWSFPSPNKMERHREDVQRILQPRAIPTNPTTPAPVAAITAVQPTPATPQEERPFNMDHVI